MAEKKDLALKEPGGERETISQLKQKVLDLEESLSAQNLATWVQERRASRNGWAFVLLLLTFMAFTCGQSHT